MMSIAYIQNAAHFIASRVFPKIPVKKQSDRYYVWNQEDWFRDEAEKRAPGTESAGSNYSLSLDSYFCDPYSIHKDVDDQTRANADQQINPDRGATNLVTQRLLLRRERAFVSKAFKAGVWGATKVGGAAVGGGVDFVRWSDYGASDPRKDIKAGRRQILASTGFLPNTLVLSYDAKDALIDHPDFIDRIKYTSRDSVTPEMLAKFFELDRVLVAMSVENAAKEGAAKSMGFQFGKHALLAHVADQPGMETPSAGYTFTWDSYAPAGDDNGVRVKRFRMEQIESDRIEGTMAFDDKIVAPELGYFFEDCVE